MPISYFFAGGNDTLWNPDEKLISAEKWRTYNVATWNAVELCF